MMKYTRLRDSQLLFRLQQFVGAEQEASEMGDHEFALECADVASVIREVMESRRIIAGVSQEAIQENSKPVYQVKGEKGGEWHDFSKLSFDEFVSMGGEGRILYTAPCIPSEAR